MNKSNSKLIASLLLIPIFLASNLSTVSADSFTDVKEGNPYYVAISYLKDKDIIKGYDDGTFKPKQQINRAEALKMLTLASGVFTDSLSKPKKAPFKDTPLDKWYTEYLAAAKDKKIIDGYKDGTFKPESTVNLAETLKMYFEAVKSVNADTLNFSDGIGTTFIDTAPDAWYSQYTSFAGAHNLIDIYEDNTINPNQNMTRGYLAEIIYRTLLSPQGYDFGNATYYFGIPEKGKNDEYDQNLMVTAHKTLPFGTIVEVTNIANGKSVKVKVTDRGPYGYGRVIDLSKKAFAKIASPSEGVISVQYREFKPENSNNSGTPTSQDPTTKEIAPTTPTTTPSDSIHLDPI
jgi:rare lipoprotein A (peptidoglycan hydrolase)/predicted DNA-binding antitoxin AbrB/MazE fold protein